ncbi:hypothetical protein VV02_25440 [Luteipulveratus mongoliensis]|uniref:MftR C-terminal domain-containing protein n=1 Tax=Luteipulveratus mongoliensis TaxID=571913 RepID=A0A0K1JPA9_9MICO|nr:hypothetical protein VV02_25440 [Luteipulveratus mongoliensis]
MLESNPKLMALAHKRFHAVAEEFIAEIEVREGKAFDPIRAKVAITLLAALFAQTLDAYISDERGRALADLYAIALRHAKELLA